MAIGKFDEMVGSIIDEYLARKAAEAVLDTAEAKVELTVNCDGETARGSISYEGNGGGYLYAAYVLLSEAVKRSNIDGIDHFLKIIKGIDDLTKKPDDEEAENEDKTGAEETAD